MRLDFKKLRHIPIEHVCDWLGIKLKKTGCQYRGSCPLCDHPSTRCFVVTPKLGLFFCFGHCGKGGDALELVAQVKQLSYTQAARLLADNFSSS